MEDQNRDLAGASAPGAWCEPARRPSAPRPTGETAAGPATSDLPLTEAELAAVERHRAARVNYQTDPREWREAWPGMVRAVIAGYRRRLTRSTFTGSGSGGAQPSGSGRATARRLPLRSMLDEPVFPGLGGDPGVGADFCDSPDDLDPPLRKGHDGLRHDRSLDRGEMPEQPEGDLR